VAVEGVWVLADVVRDVRRIFAGIGATFTMLGAIVLVLSLLGIYSILAFEVTRRTREIGVRVALGAQTIDIVRPVLGRVARLVAGGGVVGVVLGLGLGRMAAGTFLLRIPETDLAILGPLVVGVMAAALAASAVPALRALAIEPSSALRAE
jgi:putative ABC transport system permease protein